MFLDEAEEHLIIGKDLSERANLIGHGYMANYYLGNVCRFKKKYIKAEDYYNKAMSFEAYDLFGTHRFNLAKIALEAAKVMKNEKDINFKLLHACVSQNKIKQWEGVLRRLLADIYLNIDDSHLYEAEDWIQQAIEADKKNDVRFELGMDYITYAKIYKRKDDRSKAEEGLVNAIGIFKECGADGWVDKYEKEMAEF